ncbi:serine:threonine protein kinase [Echinococcus multilocularis]|uniref:SNF-related serine/threonine-protein kinase n=1 Tax=Echinococcus multilocularis TaxID=6211 RepID=A0A087W264_ECHMU|nr:serine:threonine protein kinase [Echinococcus multilocularis]
MESCFLGYRSVKSTKFLAFPSVSVHFGASRCAYFMLTLVMMLTLAHVAGLYDLGPTIGRGHYAVVKIAQHVFTGEKVAVKVIDKTKLDAPSREHLFQEVVCMKLVQHPNVVRLYEVIDTVNKLYLILELGDGGDLYDYIMKHEHGLSEKLAKRYFRQIVTAISYCHNLHVVHRDLKPENVVFFEQLGVVKLTDFGFSNQFVPGKQLDTFCGSLAYSAPEILLGTKYDAPKVDIWSLGVILFMLVCGRLPFEEANDSETLTKIMDCEYHLPPHLSPQCCSLISRLLIRDPAKRATLEEVLQDEWLQMASEELPIGLFSVPLISQEHLQFEDHMEILNKMASGGLATVDEIQQALDRNEYSHISATYFLLAERKLKRNYIEEYKLLSAQAKALEQTLILQQKTQLQSVVEQSEKPQSRSAALPKSISASLAASGAEERLRRFSMILEDEEENDEEAPSVSTVGVCGMDHRLGDEINFNETTDEALLHEEQEEFEAVASLACVRSELLSELESSDVGAASDLHALDLEPAKYFTRPNSRADLSERVASETSLNAGVGDAGRRSVSSLLTSRHLRSTRPSLRPLISVKSSPQLLDYIAEEDGEWKIQAENEEGLSKRPPNQFLTAVKQPRQTSVNRKSMSSIYANRSSMPRARSPPWSTRKFYTGPAASFSANSSRPLSGVNLWPAVDRRWRQSPSGAGNLFLTSRHTPNNCIRSTNSSTVRDNRRRSGPPGFYVLGQGNNSASAHLSLLRMSLNFTTGRFAIEAPDRDLPKSALEPPMSTLEEAPQPQEGDASNARFSVSCQSAPNILDHLFIKPPVATDVCATIREEEDENKAHSPSKDEDELKPSSPHSSLAPKTSSAIVNTHRLSAVWCAAAPTYVRASNRQQNGLTSSNFSLASLASSLRDSRHMVDVLRGTYELQMQSRRRTGGFPRISTGSSFDGLPPPPSTSPLVRSLTLVNQLGMSVSANASLRRPRINATQSALRQSSASPPPRIATAPPATAFKTNLPKNPIAPNGDTRYATSSVSTDSMPVANSFFYIPSSNNSLATTTTTATSAITKVDCNLPPPLPPPPPPIPEESSSKPARFLAFSKGKFYPLCDGGGVRGGAVSHFRLRGSLRKSQKGRRGNSTSCCRIS